MKKIGLILIILFGIFSIIFWSLEIYAQNKEFSANIEVREVKNDIANLRLRFSNPIFRAQKNISDIEIIRTQWAVSNINGEFRSEISAHNVKNGEIIGSVIYEVRFLKSFYFGILFKILGLFVAVYLFRFSKNYILNLPNIGVIPTQMQYLTRSDWIFLIFAAMIAMLLFGFQFWLGFPSFHVIGDTYNSIALVKDNAHPVFIAYVLQFLYFIFGKHLFYLFLLNLIPFYLGLFLLVAGFYLRFKSYFSLLFFALVLVGNIYFQNFISYHSFSLPNLLFLGYSALLFFILARQYLNSIFKKAFVIFIIAVFFMAILWRHNAIFSVYPAIFIGALLLFKYKINFRRNFFGALIFGALACVFIVKFIPFLLSSNTSLPANHVFLHQIAGACVPSDDSSCFKESWYEKNRNFNYVKNLYAKYPLNADPFNVPWGYDDERAFKHKKLDGLKREWIRAIFKHPSDFFAHEMRFIKAMWFANPKWILDSNQLQQKPTHSWHKEITSRFSQNERSIDFSPMREKIYDFLFSHKILFNHIYGVIFSFAALVFGGFYLIKINMQEKIYEIAIFIFSVGFSGFFSSIFISLFTPVAETRYFSPILPLGILGIIGILAFILSKLKKQAI